MVFFHRSENRQFILYNNFVARHPQQVRVATLLTDLLTLEYREPQQGLRHSDYGELDTLIL